MVEIGIVIAVVIGLVEVIKRLGLSPRFLPLAALIISVSLWFTLSGVGGVELVDGLIIGLSAVGLFSGVKNSLGNAGVDR